MSAAKYAKTLAPIMHMERPANHGLIDWLTTVDHKKIGILYGLSGFFFFFVGGLQALLFRLQITVPDATLMSGETYNALVTMHATTMVFLAVMPMTAGLANYLLPLMIGARDVAFPRLNAFSYWAFFFGAIILNASFIWGAPSAGWFGYAPLTGSDYSGIGIDFWVLGLVALAVSSMIAGTNFIVTVLNLRCPGMTLMRVPVLGWMLFVIQFLLAFSFPPIAVGLILLGFDRFFGTTFYVVQMGGDPQLWQHLFWLFGHPEVYVLILPAMGVVSEVLPVFARRPLFGQSFVVFSGIFIGFVGFGVWAHHMFTAGMGPLADAAFATTTAIIAVPTAVKIFNWLGTLWGGKLSFTTPMLFSTAFIPMFTIGGLSGIMMANPPVDLQVHDTYFIVAHFHYVLVGGSMLGLFSGIYFYFPKMIGRMLDETMGKWHFWLFLVGLNVTFFPMHLIGNHGMPRRIYTFPADAGWTTLSLVETLGVFFMAAGSALCVYNIIISLKRGAKAGDDPWGAQTLEWFTSSPPPVYNFAFTPVVRSERPVWDHNHTPGMEIKPPSEPEEIHMPSPSWKPMWVALAMTAFLVGVLVVNNWSVPAGVTMMVGGGIGLIFFIWQWINEPV